MIVICGDISGSGAASSLTWTTAVRAATAATAVGPGNVQLVAMVADDPAGDRQLQELTRHGVGHAAVLRAPGRPLEAADVELALRYLPEVRVVLAMDLGDAALRAALDAAAFAGAVSIVVIANRGASHDGDSGLPVEPPESAIVLGAPESDPEGTFAGFVAAFAVRIDTGEAPADAWVATLRDQAVDEVRRAPR